MKRCGLEDRRQIQFGARNDDVSVRNHSDAVFLVDMTFVLCTPLSRERERERKRMGSKKDEEIIEEEDDDDGPPPGWQSVPLPPPPQTQPPAPALAPVPAPPPQPPSELVQMVCGSCRRLLSYPRGARHVQCSCCQTINFVLEAHQVGQVKCSNCTVLLMYPYGALSVRCSSCHCVTEIGVHNRRPPWSVQQGQLPTPSNPVH